MNYIMLGLRFNRLNSLKNNFLDFINNFFSTNKKLLKFAYDNCVRLFEELNTIPEKSFRILPAKSAFFFLMDFGNYLKERTFEEEDKLQEKFKAEKVLIVPGKSLTMPEAGWFRVVFSASDEGELKEGIRRIFAALKKYV